MTTSFETLGVHLIVGSVQDLIDKGEVTEETGFNASRNRIQTPALISTIEAHQFDACVGGARRDEEKARAKERFFSHRDDFSQWDPKNQRPELVGLVQRQAPARRALPSLSAEQLDGAGHLELHPPREHRHSQPVFRP